MVVHNPVLTSLVASTETFLAIKGFGKINTLWYFCKEVNLN